MSTDGPRHSCTSNSTPVSPPLSVSNNLTPLRNSSPYHCRHLLSSCLRSSKSFFRLYRLLTPLHHCQTLRHSCNSSFLFLSFDSKYTLQSSLSMPLSSSQNHFFSLFEPLALLLLLGATCSLLCGLLPIRASCPCCASCVLLFFGRLLRYL